MSFALEYRKKNLIGPPMTAPKQLRRKQSPAPKLVLVDAKPAAQSDTHAKRASGLIALLMAALILAVFNSEGLRLAAGDLAEHQFGTKLLAVSEAWDDAMDRAGAKTLMAGVRKAVAEARESSWADVAGLVGVPAYAGRQNGRAVAAKPHDHEQAGLIPEHTGSLPPMAKSPKRPSRHAIDPDDPGSLGH